MLGLSSKTGSDVELLVITSLITSIRLSAGHSLMRLFTLKAIMILTDIPVLSISPYCLTMKFHGNKTILRQVVLAIHHIDVCCQKTWMVF